MAGNRNDKEAELNTLARMFVIAMITMSLTDGWTGTNLDLYKGLYDKIETLVVELGYVPEQRNPTRAELALKIERGEIG